MFFANIVIGLATAASLAVAAPTPNTEIRSPEVEGGPGSSSWPPSWKREVEGGPGSSSWPPSWKREEEGGPDRLPGLLAGRGTKRSEKSRAVRDPLLGPPVGSAKKKSAQKKAALVLRRGLLAGNVRKREALDLPLGHQAGSARRKAVLDLLLGLLAGNAMSNFTDSVKL